MTRRAGRAAPGYVFLAPKKEVAQSGPLIVDDHGQVVWFHPLNLGSADFRVQRYRGRPVLTWWQGASEKGIGQGRYEIFDRSYRQVAELRAGHGLGGDEHEFLITPQGTALITAYEKVPRNLSSLGGPKHGFVLDSVVQELDIATGRVLFEWHSLDHVGLRESYLTEVTGTKAIPHDYFHVNSIDPGPNGTLLVSARHTHAVYEISWRTGKVLWRLGGKRSDFAMGPGTRFAWQHDARIHPDGTLTIFDNGAAPAVEKHSRALVLRLDTRRMTVRLVRAYVHPLGLLAASQGNVQVLPGRDLFVGWGRRPYVTEFSRSGRVLFDMRFNAGADSYRAYRFPWVGRPTGRPALAVGSGTVYASWNGATEVRTWRVLANGRRVAVATKSGFETAIAVRTKGRRLVVQALAASGRVLGTSPAR